jgi:hypothetical protein
MPLTRHPADRLRQHVQRGCAVPHPEHATIGRVRITGPHHAPLAVVEGRRIPAAGDAPVTVRWEVVQRPLGLDALLVERGNPSA